MTEHEANKLKHLSYVLGEIQELAQCTKDKLSEMYLMIQDRKQLARVKGLKNVKLYGDYFNL